MLKALGNIKKVKAKKFLAVFLLCVFTVFPALAEEVTAIDFQGNLLGKVIPDGKVVSLDNQLIGSITADSLIVDFSGEIIGGVIPQGIAIGNDNKFLGKVNNDGSVRSPSNKIVGRVLPNALVVNDYFDVIGAVLFPGLVYADNGAVIGRLAGDGSYTNLQGQVIGIITPSGHAYRKAGNEHVLEGRLISSKMVISESGEFIGSVVPGGQVSDFNGDIIGNIRANGFVYNSEAKIIGKLVTSSYAFDNSGNYLGFVSYNGEVINRESVVGHLNIDGSIKDIKGNIIGSAVDFAATFTDSNGRYLGRILPNGDIVKAKEIVGHINAGGTAVDTEGKIVGKVVSQGPVFDYKGSPKAHAVRSGVVVSVEGSPLGYMKDNIAYDAQSHMIGKISGAELVLDKDNNPLGMTGLNSDISYNGDIAHASPFGSVFAPDGTILGKTLSLDEIYDSKGNLISQIMPNGNINIGKLTSSGMSIDERNRILGKIVDFAYITDENGNSLGFVSGNTVTDGSGNIIAKVLADNSVVSSNSNNTVEVSSKIGDASKAFLALSASGDALGTIDYNGVVRDFNNSNIGKVASSGFILDNNGGFIGQSMNFNAVVDSTCKPVGIISSHGDIRNYRDIRLGKILLNNQAVSDMGSPLGFGVIENPVADNNGNILGVVSVSGQVLNYSGASLGCIDKRGQLRSADNTLIGKIIEYFPVIGFDNNIIGRVVLDGNIINDNGQEIGYVQANGNANSKTGLSKGNLFKYKFAFGNDNKFLGRVLENGKVFNDQKQEVGKVSFDGYVISDNRKVGYALYDLYMYDNQHNTIGYITKDGNVLSFTDENIGIMDRGFLLNKGFSVIGRGNRDFYIRADDHSVFGELNFNGQLVDNSGKTLGTLQEDGGILDANGRIMAEAKPLQYYNKTIDRQKIYDESGNVIGFLNPDGTVVDENGKIIGLLNSDGTVTSANGNIIGGIGVDWYEKAEESIRRRTDIPEVGVLVGRKTQDDAKRSFSIALTPDGEYLGEIMADGRVVDKKGTVIGTKTPDGLIIDNDGGLIGIEESQKVASDGMFVPAGTFGSGSAYGVGSGPGANLGPGGGFGPGERYDPQRAAALNAAQENRRKNMSVGKISTNVKRSSFDGYQKNWDEQSISKTISSWRVDMSEMILSDKPIPAVIAHSIDSNNPVPVTAFVERNVYAEEGRNIIIPAGSRLIGTLGGLTASEEGTSSSAKVQITWDRLIRPDGILFTFQGVTADAQGRGGALGYLDLQLFKRYATPIMTTALTSYTSYLMAPKEESTTDGETPKQQAANDARQNFLNTMNQVFEQILADKANIKPLTYVPAGTRIIVFPNVDLWMRTPEREEEETEGNYKPTLIDPKRLEDEQAERDRNKAKVYGGTGGGSSVEYESEGVDAEPVTNAPLISPEGAKSRKKRKGTSSGAGSTPPPPGSFSVAPTGSSSPSSSSNKNTNTGSSSSNSNVPQLF